VLIAEWHGTVLRPDGVLQAGAGLHFYSDEVRLTHNYWGVLISLIVSGFPFAFLLTLVLTGIDPTLARAAPRSARSPCSSFARFICRC